MTGRILRLRSSRRSKRSRSPCCRAEPAGVGGAGWGYIGGRVGCGHCVAQARTH